MIKGLDELRKEIEILKGNNIDTYELVRISEAIEREVEECYVELPKDADGIPIHFGERLSVDGRYGTYIVGNMTYCTDGWSIGTDWGQIGRPEEDAHHLKLPTVEDVLRDFAYCCEEGATEQSIDEIIAEYAKRLQLREAE